MSNNTLNGIAASFFLGTLAPGCVTYESRPLAREATLAHAVPQVKVDPEVMPLKELAAHTVNVGDKLDMTETAILAILLSPELKLARDDQKVAHAQLIAAGLLPNPQLSLGHDIGGIGSTAGLSLDINALLAHSAIEGAAKADSLKTDLSLLWQEWQVVQHARLLFTKVVYQERSLELLRENEKVTLERYQRTRGALNAGNVALDAAAADTIALQEVRSKLGDMTRQLSQTRRDLNAILGISPEVRLQLVGEPGFKPLVADRVKKNLPGIARRRPDLLALEAAYQSQEEKFRQAVLSQFPSLNIGFTRTTDSGGVATNGFGITLSLPIFNRGQGNMKIEDATREKLRDEYQIRLNAAYSEIEHLLADNAILTKQLETISSSLPELRTLSERATAAYEARNIDAITYSTLRSSLLGKELERISLEETLAEQNIIIETILGHDIQRRPAREG